MMIILIIAQNVSCGVLTVFDTHFALYENTERSSKEFKAPTLEKIAEIDTKLTELKMLKDQLSTLASTCQGDDRPDCPILDALSDRNSE